MSIAVTFNGVSYTIAAPGETGYVDALQAFLQAIATALGPTTNNTITVTSGKALKLQGDITSPAKAVFCIVPQDSQPTGPNIVGDIYVTTGGIVKICTVAGTPGTWQSVGLQS